MRRFQFYGQIRDYMAAAYRQHSGLSKKAFRKNGGDAKEEATKLFLEHPNARETLDTVIIAEELQYESLGRPVYIPEDVGLLEMLWRSKMNVKLEDLAEFPRCFSIAWPDNAVVGGVKLQGCLVWLGPQNEREHLASQIERYFPNGVTWESDEADPNGFVFHLTFGRGQKGKRWYNRASMPEVKMDECLKSEDALGEAIGTYGVPSAVSLNEDERREQYTMIKLALRLMVYATACPEALLRQWPREISSPNDRKGKSPLFLKAPEQARRIGGTHASPQPHYRNMHFRRYPTRKDGMRTPGILKIDGHMVNAKMDPTIITH